MSGNLNSSTLISRLGLGALAFLILVGQVSAQPRQGLVDPDEEWEDLKSRVGGVRIAQEYNDLAAAFRDFQMRNPDHPQVGNARRLEALTLIGAWETGDDSERSRREEVVAAVRKDTSLAVGLRAEVAAKADNAAVDKQDYKDNELRIRAYAQTAQALADEFPTWLTAYESLVGIARASDPADAHVLLSRVLASSHASVQIKELASVAEERFALVGESLASQLRPRDQAALSRLPSDTPILLYTWSASQSWSLDKAVFLSERLDPQTAFLGICLDQSDLEDSQKAARSSGLPGIQIYDGDTDALYLDTPGIGYLIDGRGQIAAVSLSAEVMTKLGMLDLSN